MRTGSIREHPLALSQGSRRREFYWGLHWVLKQKVNLQLDPPAGSRIRQETLITFNRFSPAISSWRYAICITAQRDSRVRVSSGHESRKTGPTPCVCPSNSQGSRKRSQTVSHPELFSQIGHDNKRKQNILIFTVSFMPSLNWLGFYRDRKRAGLSIVLGS